MPHCAGQASPSARLGRTTVQADELQETCMRARGGTQQDAMPRSAAAACTHTGCMHARAGGAGHAGAGVRARGVLRARAGRVPGGRGARAAREPAAPDAHARVCARGGVQGAAERCMHPAGRGYRAPGLWAVPSGLHASMGPGSRACTAAAEPRCGAQEPCRSFVLRDIICTYCNFCTDLDLCRDPALQVLPLQLTKSVYRSGCSTCTTSTCPKCIMQGARWRQ